MNLERKYIIAIRTALSKKGIKEEEKETLVSGATDGRTTSIRAMKPSEAISLLKALNGTKDNYKKGEKQRKKRKILALCHEMGWQTEGGKIDMKRVNGYCESKGYLQKPFDDYSNKELTKLVQQFSQMHKTYLKK